MNPILVQVIGGIGYGLLALSYFKKEKKEILFIQIISYIMFTIHYYLLSGITGAICNLIGLFGLVAIYLCDKYKSKKKTIISSIFIVALLVINILNFQNVFSIFPLIASIIVIISFLVDDENIIRGIGLISAVCWLIYAIAYGSIIGIIFEVATLIGVFIAFVKNKKTKK